jgi:hypothetical protein
MNGIKRVRNVDDVKPPKRDSIVATAKQHKMRMRKELVLIQEMSDFINGAKRYMPAIM